MRINFYRRRYLLLWQFLFMVCATTWLWAPQLNHLLPYHTTLISQYEEPAQPYSWIFRLGDLLAGLLVFLMSLFFLRTASGDIFKRRFGWLLLVIALGMIVDPLASTHCHEVNGACQERFSAATVIHLAESFIVALAFFVASVYDSLRRRKLVSIAVAAVIAAYGAVFIYAAIQHQAFSMLIQYIFWLSLVVWMAWFCRDYLVADNFTLRKNEPSLVKNAVAAWAFLNGVAAIILSLAHIHLLGKIKGFYFAGDSGWLAEHGVLVGVALLYISRHLLRGERRARQIFLAIVAMEVFKYSLITPQGPLLALYILTFILVFVFRDDFDRGTVPMTWQLRFKDALYMSLGLGASAALALLVLDRDDQISQITSRALGNFFDYGGRVIPSGHLRSVLLAQTISVFLAAGTASLLWILFRPYKTAGRGKADYQEIELRLRRYSRSSEDFFKLWPRDKQYFWNKDKTGFIAYRAVGTVAYALADPIGGSAQELIEEFVAWARQRRLKACFLMVGEPSLGMYRRAGLELIQIGSSALIKTDEYMDITSSDKWWRWQKNRAIKQGYEYGFSEPPHDKRLLQRLKRVSDAWLKTGGHAERGFALGYFDGEYINRCRLHFLTDSRGKVVAFVNELPKYGDKRVATIDLLRYTPGNNNAMPYLLFKLIESKKAEGVELFDLGFVPFARAKGNILSIAKAIGGSRFSSQGLERFKNKFDPDWRANYIAYDGDIADLAVIALNLEKSMQV